MDIFLNIENTNGKYKISNNGSVVKINKKLPPRVLKGSVNCNGYKLISYVTSEGERRQELLHRVLAKHFLNNPENKPCINHKDGNKLNNDLDNLEWCTKAENNQHAYDTGLKEGAKKRKVTQFTKDGVLVKVHNSIMSASDELGISRATIHRQIKRERKSAGGFVWSYYHELQIVNP